MLVKSVAKRFLVLGFVLAVVCPIGGAWQQLPKAPLADTTILVIRHAEKPAQGTGLTAAGEARAKAYSSYFAHFKIDGKPFHIDHIFATADGKNSARERLTVEPLAKTLGMQVDSRFKNKDFAGLIKDIRTHNYGKGILICWHHGNIPAITESLGAVSTLIPGGKWPAATFDWVVELKYDSDGKIVPAQSKIIHEHLMPGDSK